jgi:hypothetical protein
MGEFADDVQRRLRDGLADGRPALDWQTEYTVAGTPVDVAGVGRDERVLIELEWRRADPADNTAKLFRHVDSEAIAAERITVVQLFTEYYDLSGGGVSSKRANAEFIGETAAETFESMDYTALTLGIDPPKRGGPRPDDWATRVDEVVARLVGTGPSGSDE